MAGARKKGESADDQAQVLTVNGREIKVSNPQKVLFPEAKYTKLDVVRIYRREGPRYAKPLELSAAAGDVLTTELLPGLELSLENVLRV